MLITFRRQGGSRVALWRFASLLALLAQCWIAAAPLGDARGLGASAHVEAAGTNQHYAHDEADCAACRTLALTALPLLESPRLGAVAAPRVTSFAVPIRAVGRGEPLTARSRAPPELA